MIDINGLKTMALMVGIAALAVVISIMLDLTSGQCNATATKRLPT